MVLDSTLFQTEKGGDPEIIRESQRRRGAPAELLEEVIAEYKEWTKVAFDLDQVLKNLRSASKEVAAKKKGNEDASELIAKTADLKKEQERLKQLVAEKEASWKSKYNRIGNIVHPSVPTSLSEDDNEVIRKHPADAQPEKGTQILSHHEVLHRIGGYDAERGSAIAGHRAYFLTDAGLDLNLALIMYGLAFLRRKDYKSLQTPFFMNKEVMAKTAQLEQFDEELYKVVGDGEDKYLIATSEQPISAFHMGEVFTHPAEQLPLRYAGYSTCFRKEAGAHGKDTRGIFRVHQFEKVEQFVLTEPEKSWEMFDEMIATSEEFMQSLGLSYRVVAIASGALNNAAAKKYDLEAWFPYLGEYKELVSCSNCTDYQSRSLDIRCGVKKMGERERKYVHCLNSTLCATERTLCAVLENHQTPDGVKVPDVLVPYMGGRDFIPYIKDAPKPK